MTLMLGTLAMGCFSACSSDDDVLQPEKENRLHNLTVIAGIDSDATRIALGESEDGKTKVLWSAGDQIALCDELINSSCWDGVDTYGGLLFTRPSAVGCPFFSERISFCQYLPLCLDV